MLHNTSEMTSDLNPDKFTDRPHEQVEDMAQKGEKQSRQGGFANMGPSKQVLPSILYILAVD